MTSLASPEYRTGRRHQQSSVPWVWVMLGSTLLHLPAIALLRDWATPPQPLTRATPIEIVELPAARSSQTKAPKSGAPKSPRPPAAAAQPPAPATGSATAPIATIASAGKQPEGVAPAPPPQSSNTANVPSPIAPSPQAKQSPPSPRSRSVPAPAPNATPSIAPEPAPPPASSPTAASMPPAPAESGEPLPPPPDVATPLPVDRQAVLPDAIAPSQPRLNRGVTLKVVAMRHHPEEIAVPTEQLPSPVNDPDLNYSSKFRSVAGRQTVTLQVLISQTGKLKEVLTIEDGPEPELAAYAKALVAQIQFPAFQSPDRRTTDNQVSLEVQLAPL